MSDYHDKMKRKAKDDITKLFVGMLLVVVGAIIIGFYIEGWKDIYEHYTTCPYSIWQSQYDVVVTDPLGYRYPNTLNHWSLHSLGFYRVWWFLHALALSVASLVGLYKMLVAFRTWQLKRKLNILKITKERIEAILDAKAKSIAAGTATCCDYHSSFPDRDNEICKKRIWLGNSIDYEVISSKEARENKGEYVPRAFAIDPPKPGSWKEPEPDPEPEPEQGVPDDWSQIRKQYQAKRLRRK